MCDRKRARSGHRDAHHFHHLIPFTVFPRSRLVQPPLALHPQPWAIPLLARSAEVLGRTSPVLVYKCSGGSLGYGDVRPSNRQCRELPVLFFLQRGSRDEAPLNTEILPAPPTFVTSGSRGEPTVLCTFICLVVGNVALCWTASARKKQAGVWGWREKWEGGWGDHPFPLWINRGVTYRIRAVR